MSASTLPVPPRAASGNRTLGRSRFREWTEKEAVFSWLMIGPPILFLCAMVGYPFLYGCYLSLMHRPVATTGEFIGLGNYIANWNDPVFWRVAQ